MREARHSPAGVFLPVELVPAVKSIRRLLRCLGGKPARRRWCRYVQHGVSATATRWNIYTKPMRTKQRVIEHGEVFTPPHIVRAMVDLVAEEAARVDARFFEPACGNGNFLVEVLQRKLATARRGNYAREALIAVSSLYGIDILADNVAECRQRLFDLVSTSAAFGDEYNAVVWDILNRNIIHGDTIARRAADGGFIELVEWMFFDNTVARRVFLFDEMMLLREEPLIPIPNLCRRGTEGGV